MQKHPDLTRERIAHCIPRIFRLVYTQLTPLQAECAVTPEPVPWPQMRRLSFRPIRPGRAWGKNFDCAWFRFRGVVPAAMRGAEVVALINVGGEACVFDAAGNPVQGLTEKTDTGVNLEMPKRQVKLFKAARGGERVRLTVEAGANQLWGAKPRAVFAQADLAVFNRDAWDLLFDFTFLFDLLQVLPENSRRRHLLLRALNEAANALGDGSRPELRRSRACLRPELERPASASALEVSAIGHAHIDTAWLWPLRETVRKCGRTFATALRLMQEYPEYRFGASQPQLYQMVKDHYPGLYRRIRQAVRQGRWELQGAMWVEADCNIPSGESLVRQLLHGKRFYRREFGVDVANLWLPDVFGYCAQLPQLLRRSGVDFFMTQKLSWNEFNKLPHNAMIWRGLDGSSVFTHFLPNDNYNCNAMPRDLIKFETHNRDNDRLDYALCLYGIGDGGGGPGRGHIERLRRARNLEGLPRFIMEPASAFAAKAQRNARDLLTWSGELYFENHRGTYTTQARMKQRNRRLEFALREAECLWALAGLDRYPSETLDGLWKTLLLNQFHDIIPGSSIARVYREAHEQYDRLELSLSQLLTDGERWYAAAVNTRGVEGPLVVRNSLSWEREDTVLVPGAAAGFAFFDLSGAPLLAQPVATAAGPAALVRVKTPALGHTVISRRRRPAPPAPSSLRASPERLENDLLQIEFAADGTLRRIYDRLARREVLAAGGGGNRFCLYEDRPTKFEAWNVDIFYMEKPPTHPRCVSRAVLENGPLRATVRLTLEDRRYRVVQDVSLTEGSRRIDFRTWIDWAETERSLRVCFPVNVQALEASYEVQFGHVRRPTHQNTSWDVARFEVVAHKWADLSQPDYGVALLNDSKYGHQILGNCISLHLLRSPTSPDATADRHEHTFTYALLPHPGDMAHSEVIRRAYELNAPLRAAPTGSHPGAWPATCSLLQIDAPAAIVETVKKAEDAPALIVRLYEALGTDAAATLTLPRPIRRAEEVNLLEEEPVRLRTQGRRVSVSLRPFEVKTLRLTLG